MSQNSTDNGAWLDASNAYIISGSIAGPLLLFVLYTFCRFKRIRSHPAEILFARTISDTGFIFTILILSSVVDNNEINEKYAQKICSSYGPLIAFFFLTSQFYFIGMCYDLYVTCTYPLRSTKYTANIIHITSWSLSAIICIAFQIINSTAYSAYVQDEGEICFLGINNGSSLQLEQIQEWSTFLGPYIIGILSGLSSLIFVFFRLKNGLGDIFEHAHTLIKDHIIFVSLYTILGIAWFILLLETLDSGGLSFAISFIIVGTASIDFTSWILQKFRTRSVVYRSTNLGNFLRKQTEVMGKELNDSDLIILSEEMEHQNYEQTMSSALRLELIRNMCSGVTQSLEYYAKNHQCKDEVTALHFSPVSSLYIKKGSERERECIANECLHRFSMKSHSSGSGNDQIDFIDYSPHVFRYLRSHCFKTSEKEFIQSIRIAIENNSSMEQLSAKFSEGKSGAFFFMTIDSQFMIKTVRKSEAVTFLKMLPGYFEHMRKFNNSFITQFYGLYGIKLYGTRLFFTVMKNIFVPDLEPHEKYDIKGSWINRRTKHHIELGKLMKDEDLKKNVLIPIDESKKAWEQMSHDTRFLNTLNIMDYSLLLGIYYIGICRKDANLSSSNWTYAATNKKHRGSYIPPQKEYQPKYQQKNVNIEMQQKSKDSLDGHDNDDDDDDMKYEQLKDENTKKNVAGLHISVKSDFLDLNTMSAMKAEFKNEDLEAKFSPRGIPEQRRRAFTAGTGIAELSSHPMSYASRIIEGPGFYIMGIIDVLQDYSWEKRIERFFKVFISCVDGYGISCIEPTMYRKRFLAKMMQIGIGRERKRL